MTSKLFILKCISKEIKDIFGILSHNIEMVNISKLKKKLMTKINILKEETEALDLRKLKKEQKKFLREYKKEMDEKTI